MSTMGQRHRKEDYICTCLEGQRDIRHFLLSQMGAYPMNNLGGLFLHNGSEGQLGKCITRSELHRTDSTRRWKRFFCLFVFPSSRPVIFYSVLSCHPNPLCVVSARQTLASISLLCF